MNVTLSDCFVDGITAIGKLPLVKFLDIGSLDLNNLILCPLADQLKYAYDDTIIHYQHKYALYIGTSGGMPFYLVTSLSAVKVRLMLLEFIGQSKASDIGYVNGWLADGLHAAQGMLANTVVSHYSKVVVTVQLLEKLSNWLSQRVNNDKIIQGGIFWFGMQMPNQLFFANWLRIVTHSDILAANIVLSVEMKSTPALPCIVTMNQEVEIEFRSFNTKWYHPFGLIGAVSCFCKGYSRLGTFFSSILDRNIDSIYIGQSELKNCCPPEIKLQRAACAASALIGGQWVQEGCYKDQCQNVYHWAECIDSGLHGVYRHGSVLQFELVMPLGNGLCSEDIKNFRYEVKTFFEQNNRLVVIPARDLPYHEYIAPAINIIKMASIHNLKKVVAAEAYLRLIVDGSSSGAYYPGLKATLGRNVEEAFRGNGHFIAPTSVNYDSLTWSDIQIEKLAIPVAFFLNISSDSAHQILRYVVEKYPDAASIADKSYGIFWIEMIKLLLSIDTGSRQIDCWSIDHQQRKGQLVGTIDPERLVDVLLYKRVRQATNKLRVLGCTLIRTYLDSSFPKESEDFKKLKLGLLIKEGLIVFPQSLPVSVIDRIDRWWRVGADPDSILFDRTMLWMKNKLPCSVDLVPAITKITMNTTMVNTGWHLINQYIQSPQNVHFQGVFEWFLRSIWLFILAISYEQIIQNDYSFHANLPWAEWNNVMGNRIDQILAKVKAWSIIIQAPKGTPKKETIFGYYQIPRRMPERLEQLQAHFVKSGIIILPESIASKVSNLTSQETAPENDGGLNDEVDERSTQNFAKRHIKRQLVNITLQ